MPFVVVVFTVEQGWVGLHHPARTEGGWFLLGGPSRSSGCQWSRCRAEAEALAVHAKYPRLTTLEELHQTVAAILERRDDKIHRLVSAPADGQVPAMAPFARFESGASGSCSGSSVIGWIESHKRRRRRAWRRLGLR